MEFFYLLVSAILIFSVSGFVLNYEDEDHIFDMLLNDDYTPVEVDDYNDMTANEGQQPLFANGVWLCGNCSDISEKNIIHNESYDVETSYEEEMELMIGFAMNNMRCIKIKTEDDGEVATVGGACSSEMVTIKVVNTNHCDIWIYS